MQHAARQHRCNTNVLLLCRCQGINNLSDVWDTSNGECVVVMQSEVEKMFEKVGWTIAWPIYRAYCRSLPSTAC